MEGGPESHRQAGKSEITDPGQLEQIFKDNYGRLPYYVGWKVSTRDTEYDAQMAENHRY